MDEFKVSVIIPVYNSRKFLKECMDSVLKQTLQNVELICVDDGSTDDSGLILKEYADKCSRITVISQTNKGVSAARNVGLSVAHGQYIYYLDSDDFIEPDMLETACRELDNKNLDVVYFDTYAFAEEGIAPANLDEKNRYYARSCEYSSVYAGEELLYKMLGNHDYSCPVWKQVARREFLEKHRVKFYEGIIHEDELYTIQTMMLAKRVTYIHRVLHHRRLRNNSLITSPLEFRSPYGYFIFVKEAYRFLINRGCSHEKLNLLLDFLMSMVANARNQFLKLQESDRKKYELLFGDEKFLFQIGISDYVNVIEQRNKESTKNSKLLQEKVLINQKLKTAQQKVEQIRKYETARIDVKNFGTEENNVVITGCSDEMVQIQKPAWFKNEQGAGIVIQSSNKHVELEMKCIGNGTLHISLRGIDFRDKNNERIPVWIEFTGLSMDNDCIFNSSQIVWHDKPFVYKREVSDGQIIKVSAEWQTAQDSIAKDRVIKLKQVEALQKKTVRLEQKKLKIEQNLENAKLKSAKFENELKSIKNGWSFKLGRIITWLPRKIKGIF